MKKILAATAFAACAAAPTAVLAQDQPSGTGGPHTFTANIGLFSEYIFRGVTQTGGDPAVQGGFDYSHASGFYAGTWASNISWLQDFKTYEQSSIEWDFYGGFKRNFGSSDFFYDVGTIYYWFPGNKIAGWSANTWEGYIGVGWKWLGVRMSYSFKDYFGARPNANADPTDGTIYWDLFANYPVGDTGITLMADWKLGASYVIPTTFLKGTEVGAFYTDTDVKNGAAGTNFYRDLTSKGLNTADSAFVVYVKKTF